MRKKLPGQKASKLRAKMKVRVATLPILRSPYAMVLADGSLGKTCWQVLSSRVSKGCYHLEFMGADVVRLVLVKVVRKPHSRQVFARVTVSNPRQAVLGNLNSVEVYLVNSQMEPLDRPFSVATQGRLPSITP
jgi:hypothetical protein